MSVVYDYSLKMWMNGNLFFVNGCATCGYPEKGHAWSSNCWSMNPDGLNRGRYTAPSQSTILYRMKQNRSIRTG